MRADELCGWFGVSASTGGNKAKPIRDLLRFNQMDGKWMLPGNVFCEISFPSYFNMMRGAPMYAKYPFIVNLMDIERVLS
jgi:hypothetical protein